MPVEVTTSPAMAPGADEVVTAAFNAPQGALLVAAWAGVNGGTVSGGELTWTLRKQHGGESAQLWTATVPAAKTGMTAEIGGDFPLGALKVWVVTGADLNDPVGASGSGDTTANNATVNGYTSLAAGSLGFCAAFEAEIPDSVSENPSSADVAEWHMMQDIYFSSGCCMSIRKATPTPAAGQTVTFNMNAIGAAAADWVWAAIEVRGLPEAAPPRIVGSAAAQHRAASW